MRYGIFLGTWLALVVACSGSSGGLAPQPPSEDEPSDASDTNDRRDASTDADIDGAAPQPPETHDFQVNCGNEGEYTLEEGDVVRWSFVCEGDSITSFTSLPEGATYREETNVLEWTPRLDQGGWFEFTARSAAGVETRLQVWVLDRFDHPANVPVEVPESYTYEHGLPVFHLRWHSPDPDYCRNEVRRDPVPADIVVGGHAHAHAELRCRGQTSMGFPKKSFTLRFSGDDPFRAPPELAAFEGRRRLILTQTFDDNLQLRTRLGFELWNQLDPANIRIDHGSAVVFVDGEYQGLYQVTDDVNDRLMELRGLDRNGTMYKSETHAGNYRTSINGVPKADLTLGYEKAEGEPEDDFTSLIELLQWISHTPLAEFEASIDERLRTEDFLDWYIFATAIVATDTYAKNTHVYHALDGPDLRFRLIPWDLNESFGQNWFTERVPFDLEGKYAPRQIASNGLWERFSQSSVLTERLEQRYAAALNGPASLERMLQIFDSMVEQVSPAAERDGRRWDEARRSFPLFAARTTPFTTFDEEVSYVRAWIQERWAFLHTEFPP